ncbi:hypothetical protein CWI36_0266p0010 [Hamiltosporidium magnivora]|uniref:ERCC4 domain-containing protein n=1 Tax=Hamiltosporidium magnivora TaxID=148818 RepID=A0A4Q9LJ19_9MICR|nr:hypothetical protein CWI36_0266p0010 [Hamiltosporidium magnivora]
MDKKNEKTINIAKTTHSDSSLILIETPFKVNEEDIKENRKYISKFDINLLDENKIFDEIEINEIKKTVKNSESEKNFNFEIKQNEDSNILFHKTEGCFIDPLFYKYKFEIPNLLKKIVDSVVNKNFRYFYSENNILLLRNVLDNSILFSALVCEYERLFDLKDEHFSTKIIFILGREKYVKKLKTNQRLEYKKALEEHKTHDFFDKVKDLRKKTFMFQLKFHVNFIFIESNEDILREFKVMIKFLETPKVFIPKVKKHKADQKKEFFKYILTKIPGISITVGIALSDKFSSLKEFVIFLNSENSQSLINFMIPNENKTGHRKLGQKQYQIIYNTFLEDNGDFLLK